MTQNYRPLSLDDLPDPARVVASHKHDGYDHPCANRLPMIEAWMMQYPRRKWQIQTTSGWRSCRVGRFGIEISE